MLNCNVHPSLYYTNAGIEVSTTFTVLHPDTLPDLFSGKKGPKEGCYLYGRSFSPSVAVLGKQLAALEGTESAYCTASGMSAISSTLLNICNSGDHIVASDTVYGGTYAFLKDFVALKCGIKTTFVKISDHEEVQRALEIPNTKALYVESVANPTLVVADIPALAEMAHSIGAKLVVDNTFAPVLMTPARWGADVVVHSLTKYISGASDVVAGAVCSTLEFIQSLMDLKTGPLMLLGPTLDPKIASELSLRLPHLSIRMVEHSKRALYFAQNLAALGASVTYPGLPDHPQHQIFKKLANMVDEYGFGGMLTLNVGSLKVANMLMERLQNKHGFGLMAVSLGYFDTLMSASAISTSSELSESELAASGISSGLVRMSIGLTGSIEQRWNALKEAYLSVSGSVLSPRYKAAMLVRDKHTGKVLHRTPSWKSFGSVGEGGKGDDSREETEDAVQLPETSGRPLKVRRIATHEELAYYALP